VLSGTINRATERVRSILRWRGFLVGRGDNERLFLLTGSVLGDLEFLLRNGFEVQRITGEEGYYAEIRHADSIPDTILFQVFNHAPQSLVHGPFKTELTYKQNWTTFKKRRFGAKTPVEMLDPGIALLVKVLPLIGVHVIGACDGHLCEPPYIRLLSTHHLNWARLILRMFAPTEKSFEAFACHLVFNLDRCGGFPENIGVWRLATKGCGNELQVRFNLYESIQRLASSIIRNECLASWLREAKSLLPSPEALGSERT
jgi:hypothetical protein